ncbi:AAA family ATPase [Paenibacillus xerothermodurans]|uniref:AAA family ATPase n=1 Tax=Paenibacillus xerothermodurans TaxID=1977292 RepID=A0A2W1NF01_PAEXE|nr:AAA family ATPase [Paenibacillus xerothermodurans]PZE21631.1 AAA family ATPase [Paenibacillus xerothermodurans]
MSKMVFFLGPAGAGKTTLAKAVASRRRAAFFDMDTLSRPAAEAILLLSGLDPNDRDSAVYKTRCRDLGYRITMDAALENAALHTDVFIVGPFTRETENQDWLDQELAEAGLSQADVDVKVVFVYLAEESLYRERIRERGLELDTWKLENWTEFRQSVKKRDIHWKLSSSSILYLDNSAPLAGDVIARVERFIFG